MVLKGFNGCSIQLSTVFKEEVNSNSCVLLLPVCLVSHSWHLTDKKLKRDQYFYPTPTKSHIARSVGPIFIRLLLQYDEHVVSN